MIYEQISTYFSKHKDIIAAYSFGSSFKGKTTPLSDVDIALLLDDETNKHRVNEIIFDLSSRIFEISGKQADIKILNNISDLPFIFEVLSSGKLIYETDKNIHQSYVENILISYQDFKPFYEIALKNYSRKIKNGSSKYTS